MKEIYPNSKRERGGREGEGREARAWKSREEGRRREVEGREERESQETRSFSHAFLLSKSWKMKTAIRKKKKKWGTSLRIQWLRVQASNAGGMGSPVSKLKILHAVWSGQKKGREGDGKVEEKRARKTEEEEKAINQWKHQDFYLFFPLLFFGG